MHQKLTNFPQTSEKKKKSGLKRNERNKQYINPLTAAADISVFCS